MHVVCELHKDGDGYLKYLVKKIFLDPKTFQEYCDMYKDRIVIFQDKAYLNGEIISEDLALDEYLIKIEEKNVHKIKAIKELNDRYEYFFNREGKIDHELYVYGNMYYICETDGLDLDINRLIYGYGSFPRKSDSYRVDTTGV